MRPIQDILKFQNVDTMISDSNIKMVEYIFEKNPKLKEVFDLKVNEKLKKIINLPFFDKIDKTTINQEFKRKQGLVYLIYELANEISNMIYLQEGTIFVFNSLNGILPILLRKKYLNKRIICLEYFPYHIEYLENLGFEVYQIKYKNGKLILPEKIKREIKNMKIVPNSTIGNPPYNSGIDLKFLKLAIEELKSDKVVFVHPSTYLLDRKGKNNFNEIKELLDNKLVSVKLFNGNPLFGIGLFVPCVIINYVADFNGLCEVDYFGDKFKSDVWNITKFGKEWETIVKPFMEKIKIVCANGNNVWNKRIEKREEQENEHYCQFAAIIGNHNKKDDLIQDDFYTLVMKDGENNKGIRNKIVRKDGYIVYKFDTENELNNFLQYCKTYFVRFCLSICKNTQSMHYGEMSLIPWLDFTQEWTDEKLFKNFNIDKRTQEYIYNFLPDYYGIEKNV